MAFTGNESHDFPLATAAEWTKNYRNANLDPTVPLAHYFGKTAIIDILSQDNCVGMRIYYGLNEAGIKQLILVGVTAEGNDLVNGLIAERSITCPTDCSSANPLNS